MPQVNPGPLTLCVNDILNLLDAPASSTLATAVHMRIQVFQQTLLAAQKQQRLQQWKTVASAFAASTV